MKVTKEFSYCYGHILPNHIGECKNPHGHNAVLEVTLDGEPDDRGMVIDFGELEEAVGEVVDLYDHAWIFGSNDPIEMFELWEANDWKRVYLSAQNATAEEIAYQILDELYQRLPDKFVISVKLYETSSSWVEVS